MHSKTNPVFPRALLFTAALTLLFLFSFQTRAASEPDTATDFRIFDAMRFTDRPDLTRYGIEPIRIIYTAQIWPGKIGLDDMPAVEDVLRLAQSSRTHRHKWGDLVILDVEHWRLRGDFEDVSANLKKYESVLAMFRTYAPGLQFGYYGTVPIVDFMRAHRPLDYRHQQWRDENSRLQSLANEVDALFPSLYARRTDIDSWVSYARAQISEARRVSPTKPVYVFLMPQYHPAAKLHPEKMIDGVFWLKQLETASELADGVVIWGGKNLKTKKPLVWDENAPWWRQTKEFLRARGNH